jgi:hypothetical protein
MGDLLCDVVPAIMAEYRRNAAAGHSTELNGEIRVNRAHCEVFLDLNDSPEVQFTLPAGLRASNFPPRRRTIETLVVIDRLAIMGLANIVDTGLPIVLPVAAQDIGED